MVSWTTSGGPPRAAEVVQSAAAKLWNGGGAGASAHGTPEDADELRRRRTMVVYYLLRAPVFELFTHPVVERFRRGTENIPLVGSLTSYMDEMLVYLHRYHFCKSQSDRHPLALRASTR